MGKQNKEILVNIFNWAEMGISIPEIMNAWNLPTEWVNGTSIA